MQEKYLSTHQKGMQLQCVCMSSHVLQRVDCCVSSLHRALPYCFGACQQSWHDNCPCESDVGSEEPSGRTEIKHCISVQEDLQYVCCVDVFIQQNCFGITAMRRASVVDISGKKPAYGHVFNKKQIKCCTTGPIGFHVGPF